MPTYGELHGRNLSPMYRAWERHYEAKGCTREKARKVAFSRVRRKPNWPPGHVH